MSLTLILVMVAQEVSSLYHPRHWTSVHSKMSEQTTGTSKSFCLVPTNTDFDDLQIDTQVDTLHLCALSMHQILTTLFPI
jgi:hypothetical protein